MRATILLLPSLTLFLFASPSLGQTIFSDDFESGDLSRWTTTATSPLVVSTAANAAPPSPVGRFSAMMTSSLARMHHNVIADNGGVELGGHFLFTAWIYDEGTNSGTVGAIRIYNEIRGYAGGTGLPNGGTSASGTLSQLLAAGKMNSVTLPGETFAATKYQGRVGFGPGTGGSTGWFNLDSAGSPNRSVGWHRFDIEAMLDGTTVRFYVDGVLSRTFTGAASSTYDTLIMGPGLGTQSGNAWIDGVQVRVVPEFLISCPADLTVSASDAAGAVVSYPAPAVVGGCPPIAVNCIPPSGAVFPIGTTPVTCTAADGCYQTAACNFLVNVLPPPPEHFFPTNNLPPTNGVYVGRKLYHTLLRQGIVMRNTKHHRFFQNFQPPPLGGTDIHDFGSQVDFELSTDGGQTFSPMTGQAQVVAQIHHTQDAGGKSFFDTEMLALNIFGGPLLIRESPTLPSRGQTTVRTVPGGCLISSFFDIFLELSFDGGQSWQPADEAVHVELFPDPEVLPAVPEPTPLLPPPNDAYVSSPAWQGLYPQGIVIKEVKHKLFTPSLPPPPQGVTETHAFDSQLDLMVSMDGGQTFRPARASAPVQVDITGISAGGDQTYDTEMLSLNCSLSGATPGAMVMLRESPTLPSRGTTRILPLTDGTFQISSFFDIFTEISLDGGQTWLPGTNGPAHVELISQAPENPFSDPNLPPSDGAYLSPPQWHALYAQGVIISNVIHRRFTQNFPPPPSGGPEETHSFWSSVECDLSMDFGHSWQHLSLPAHVTVSLRELPGQSAARFFDTEMLQLDISGPGRIMIRESPSKASLGRTSVRQNAAGGQANISSFFDIFTELSTDGGQSWSPSMTAPSTVALIPGWRVPPTLMLICPGDLTAYTANASGTTVSFAPYAVTDCLKPMPNMSVACVPPSGSLFPIGVTTVTCSGTDTCGGAVTCSFQVTVKSLPIALVPEFSFKEPKLPPPNGMYLSPPRWRSQYPNGVIISNVIHRQFLQSFRVPPPGGSELQSFGSTFELLASGDGGQNWMPVSGPADVTVQIAHAGTDADGTQRFDTEMLRLNLAVPGAVMIRESPSLPSRGQTTVRTAPGGGAMISSFFDIFTEISLDGGKTWSPAQEPTHLELRVDPTTVQPVPELSPLLPPPDGQYVSPPDSPALLAQGVVIKDLRHKFLSDAVDPRLIPLGDRQEHRFHSIVDMQVSMDGGKSFRAKRSEAELNLSLQPLNGGPVQLFDTEMLQMDIAGGDLPPQVRIRESPTLPSRGGTALEQVPDGTFRIGSFFDIFTEISLDGGQTWQPSASGPAHVELQRVAPISAFPSPNLPPADGQYISPPEWHALYANGIILSNVVHREFTLSQPPPEPGQSRIEVFDSMVDVMVSTDNGQTFSPYSAPAMVALLVTGGARQGAVQYYETEMLQLDITGGTLPGGVMIRESPSKASLGRTSMLMGDAASGQYRIGSFFDIFTEMSLDGGQSWSPSVTEPATVALIPRLPYAPFVIHCPPDVTTFAAGSGGATVSYPPPTFFYPDCPFGPFTVTCTPPSGSVFPAGTTVVTCTGYDGCGERPTCSFNVTVLALPIIYLPSLSLVVTAGIPARLTAELASTPPTLYRWGVWCPPTDPNYPNCGCIPDQPWRQWCLGCPPPFVDFPQVTRSCAGGYYLVASNSVGMATSEVVQVTVLEPPVITAQPATQSAPRCPSPTGQGGVTFTVEATGSPAPDFYWSVWCPPTDPKYPNCGCIPRPPIPGTARLTLPSFSPDCAGSYFVVVSNAAGSVTSTLAELVLAPEVAFSNKRFPTPNSRFEFGMGAMNGLDFSPAKVAIRELSLRPLGSGQPFPPPGAISPFNFEVEVVCKLSLDGGATRQSVAGSGMVAIAPVQGPPAGAASPIQYEMEMTALDLTLSGAGQPVLRVRESPTKASLGKTRLAEFADGSVRLGSFFDIFTEISLDGGQTWVPCDEGSRRAMLEPTTTEFAAADDNYPPSGSELSQAGDGRDDDCDGVVDPVAIVFPGGLSISNLTFSRLSGAVPFTSLSTPQTFPLACLASFDLQTAAATTHHMAPATLTLRAGNRASTTFDTEMLSLDITGGTLPAGLRLRESPTLPSRGYASRRANAGGPTRVSSFFDIFTEISLDGGQSWISAVTGPAGVGIRPTSPEAPFRIFCPGDITVTAASASGAVVNYLVTTAPGDCPLSPPPPTVTCVPPSGSTFPVGTTTVTCAGSNGCGEHPACSFKVTVQPLPPNTCLEPDNGSGTATLPPPACQYISPDGAFMIIDGLPSGTTITLSPVHRDFVCNPQGGTVCSNDCFTVDDCDPGNGAIERFLSALRLNLAGSGTLNGWTRNIVLSGVLGQIQLGPRTPGDPVQSFDTDMMQLQGQLPPGDPDFDLLRITAGTSFGLPSPGHTTLTRLAGGNWAVDSFFDITYRIDFVGAPGGTLAGRSGSTTGTIRMVAVRPDCTLAITCPADLTVTALQSNTVVNYPAPTVVGSCPPINVVCVPPPTAAFPLGVTSVACTATDAAGNTASCSFQVTVLRKKHFFPTANLPPLTGQYVSPQEWHAAYANGIIISNAVHRRFTQTFPPPPPGASQTHSFGSQVSLRASMDGGKSFQSFTAPANVTVRLSNLGMDQADQLYDTEMLALDISGAGGLMIRESPTRASTGQTRIMPVSGGFLISSFFDIFTEISLDGGQSWSPAQMSAPMELQIDPGSSPTILVKPRLEGGTPSFSLLSQRGLRYFLERKNRLDDPGWSPLSSVPGDGQEIVLTDGAPGSNPNRFYRVRVEEDNL